VEKLRAKRAFEASLPPLDDASKLPLRQKLIEEWEAQEWREREEEIHGVQQERLVLLEQALQVNIASREGGKGCAEGMLGMERGLCLLTSYRH
jgi:hypothetical protein